MGLYTFKLEQERLQEEAAKTEARRTQGIDAARDRLTPLSDRLTRVLAAVPVEIQKDGLSLPSVQVMLKGRSRGRAHPGEL